MTDIRDLLVADIKRHPGLTGDEVAALHPDRAPKQIKKVLRALCRSWGDLRYEVSRDGSRTGNRHRFYLKEGPA